MTTPLPRLDEYAPRPELVVEEHPVPRARFPVIDAHNHLGYLAGADGPARLKQLLADMDACNLRAIVDLDGNRGWTLPEELALLAAAPARFAVLTVLPWQEALDAGGDVGANLAQQLETAVRQGARGLKIHKTLGLEVRDRAGKLVMPDDPRFAPVFAKCAELGVPCLIHVADPIAFFRPLDLHNERYRELAGHSDWHFHGRDYPSFAQLMECQERLFTRHPRTRFQSAHVASASEDLTYVSGLLDRCPNLSVDIGARIAELGRQPYSARRFFLRYADRILFGTDVPPTPAWQRVHYRFLEASDEYFPYAPDEPPGQGEWRIYGLGLPDDVLEKVYWRNAARLYAIPA